MVAEAGEMEEGGGLHHMVLRILCARAMGLWSDK